MGHQRQVQLGNSILSINVNQRVVDRWRRCAQQRPGMERDTREINSGLNASGMANWGELMVSRRER
jgi:hypothetical protein